MCGRKTHRVLNPGVVPNLHARIVPPIKTMANVTAVAEGDALHENYRARMQCQFHVPFHPINSVYIAHSDARAALLVLVERGVHMPHRGTIPGKGAVNLGHT